MLKTIILFLISVIGVLYTAKQLTDFVRFVCNWRTAYSTCVHMKLEQFWDIFFINPDEYTLCEDYVRRYVYDYQYEKPDYPERKNYYPSIRTSAIEIAFDFFDTIRYVR